MSCVIKSKHVKVEFNLVQLRQVVFSLGSVKEFAGTVGLSQTTIYHYLKYSRIPSSDALFLIAQAGGVTMESFFRIVKE